MDVREKYVMQKVSRKEKSICPNCIHHNICIAENNQPCFECNRFMDANGVTMQEYAEWVHPKGYVVSNGFLCSKCGHKEASYYPINPRPGGAYIADENGNFFYPPKLNYCPSCGAKMNLEV